MQLLPDWKQLVRRAWSIRWMAVGFLATAAEGVLSLFGKTVIPGPEWVKMAAAAAVFGLAFWSRITPQKNLP